MRKRTKNVSLGVSAFAALAIAALLAWLFSFEGTLGLAQWNPPWRLNFILIGAAGLLPLVVALAGLPRRHRDDWKPGAAIAVAAMSLSVVAIALAGGLFAQVETASGVAKSPIPALKLVDPSAGIRPSGKDGILRLSFSSDPHWGAPSSSPSDRIALLESVAAARPRRDAFFILGDNVEMGMEESSWLEEARDLSAHLGEVPVRSILGNHDGLIGGQRLFESYFSPPAIKTDTGSPFYYSMEAGPATIIVIDLLWGAESFGQAQAAWLEKRLSEVQAGKQVIVLSHSYVYASGYIDEFGLAYYDKPEDIAKVAPILERHKVALVVSGHDHDMELLRSNGVTYAVVGVMGGVLDPAPSYRSPASLWFRGGTHGRLDADVSERGIALTFVDSRGAKLYEAEIPKAE
jgi:hypothetical protein